MSVQQKLVVLGFTEDSVCYFEEIVSNAKPCGQNSRGGLIYDVLSICTSYEEFKNFLFNYQSLFPVVVCEQNVFVKDLSDFLLQLQDVTIDTFAYVRNFTSISVNTCWGNILPNKTYIFKNGTGVKIFTSAEIQYITNETIKNIQALLSTVDFIESIDERRKDYFKTKTTFYSKSITTPNLYVYFSQNLSRNITETFTRIEIKNKDKGKEIRIYADGVVLVETRNAHNMKLDAKELTLSSDLDENIVLLTQEIAELILDDIIIV